MGLCSSNQKRRLAVTTEQHELRDLRKYSDAQARELLKKNAQIIKHQVEIRENGEELVEARETVERLQECLKIQEDLHETSEQRHLDNFQNIVRAVSVAANGFKGLEQAKDKQCECSHQTTVLP